MASVNKCILVGNLGRDPEVRKMSSGDSVVSFSLALSDSWKDKTTGERKERTEWVNVVIFNENIGRVAESYLKKGSKCYLEGALQTREFTDKDGNQRKVTEVVLQRFRGELVLLDSKGGETSSQPAREPERSPGQRARQTSHQAPVNYDDEDTIPF